MPRRTIACGSFAQVPPRPHRRMINGLLVGLQHSCTAQGQSSLQTLQLFLLLKFVGAGLRPPSAKPIPPPWVPGKKRQPAAVSEGRPTHESGDGAVTGRAGGADRSGPTQAGSDGRPDGPPPGMPLLAARRLTASHALSAAASGPGPGTVTRLRLARARAGSGSPAQPSGPGRGGFGTDLPVPVAAYQAARGSRQWQPGGQAAGRLDSA